MFAKVQQLSVMVLVIRIVY